MQISCYLKLLTITGIPARLIEESPDMRTEALLWNDEGNAYIDVLARAALILTVVVCRYMCVMFIIYACVQHALCSRVHSQL